MICRPGRLMGRRILVLGRRVSVAQAGRHCRVHPSAVLERGSRAGRQLKPGLLTDVPGVEQTRILPTLVHSTLAASQPAPFQLLHGCAERSGGHCPFPAPVRVPNCARLSAHPTATCWAWRASVPRLPRRLLRIAVQFGPPSSASATCDGLPITPVLDPAKDRDGEPTNGTDNRRDSVS